MTVPLTSSRDTAETAELLHAELHNRMVLDVTFVDVGDDGTIVIRHCPPGYPHIVREVAVSASALGRVLADVLPGDGAA